ncbi:MAG: restriction endonuclease subunit S [Deltaproteobacteria bacterium]|nr:restriction endonuclease subunit S [Deltaproteobacteria bacterium]
MSAKRQLPPGWAETTFGEIATFKNGANFSASDRGTELKMLGVGDFQDRAVLKDTKYLKSVHLASQPSEDNFLETEDLVFVRSNGSKELVGRCLHIECSPRLLIYSGFCIRARLYSDVTSARYVNLLMQNGVLKKQLVKDGRGTNISNLNQGILDKLTLVLPPLAEQRAIANLLTSWDEAINKTKELIKAKEKRYKWLLREFISEPQNLQNGVKWEKLKFKHIFKSNHCKNVSNKDLPVLSVTTNGIVFQSEYFNKEVASDDKASYLIVERGDFVMSGLNFWMGSIDFQTICEAGVVSPAYKVFKLTNGSCVPEYLHHFIRSDEMLRILDRSSVQGASIVRRNLDTNALNNSYINLPCKNSQMQIASTLSSAQHEIDLLKQLADKYKTQKRGLMQKMLTGEWRVKPEIVNQYMEANHG